jgi:biotin transport system substrate-specific component
MTSLAQAIAPPRHRPLARATFNVLAVVGGSLMIAGLAQVSIKLPITPVPFTGQTLGVLLVGAALGWELGVASVVLYLAEGAVGLPFYAGGEHGWRILVTQSPALVSGGYLWGFVLAALVVGWLSRRGWDRSVRSAIGAMFIGEVVLFLVGVPWLMAALNVPLEKGLELGLYPFVIGDTLKLLLAAGLLPAAWRLARRADRKSV